jgi:hypothetical protein
MGQIIRHLAVSGISGGDLKGIPIPLPSLPEQNLIAAQLASVDSKLLAEEGRQTPMTLLFHALLNGLFATKRGEYLVISPFGVCHVTLQDPTSSHSTQTA